MDVDVIERLIALFDGSRLAELDYTEGGARLRLVRRAEAAAVQAAPAAEPLASPAEPSPTPAPVAPGPAQHVVAAGLFGTFYRSPAPGQPPFVAVGDIVREGQTLAILEAMKMLNPVEADRAGRVAAILVEDGASVEAGTPLLVLAAE